MGSVRERLAHSPVTVSAPCRVDTGGTWDIKALALPLERQTPATVNMALTLRTAVTLRPCKEGRVKIFSRGFSHTEEASADRLPFHSPFGLFFAAVSYFGFHGLEVEIDSQSPVKSALGGSSTALVALLGALGALRKVGRDNRGLSRKELLHLAYHLEDGISGGNCGIQDQAAAVYGGAHLWKWHFGRPADPLTRIPLLDQKGLDALSNHMLVAYSGKSHVAAHTNRQWVNDFLSGKTRSGWIKANGAVHSFARAIQAGDWDRAAFFLREEMALRREITPEALDDVTEKMVTAAESVGCGGRFAGAGAGGSVWALGKGANMDKLRQEWQKLLAPIKDAQILDAGVDAEGVRLENFKTNKAL
ncbi:MAG: galactokinase [Deltaproteobacteria bacterium]|nr:galactokinase [Deltaproteobacteria bacterium]